MNNPPRVTQCENECSSFVAKSTRTWKMCPQVPATMARLEALREDPSLGVFRCGGRVGVSDRSQAIESRHDPRQPP